MTGKQQSIVDKIECDLKSMTRGISYADLKSNTPICESYVSAMRAMGHHTLLDNSEQKGALAGASTDMGSFPFKIIGANLLTWG